MLRLLKQLTEVYSTLKISSLAAMVPFATMGEIEAIIVDAVRYDYLQVREASGKVCVGVGGRCGQQVFHIRNRRGNVWGRGTGLLALALSAWVLQVAFALLPCRRHSLVGDGSQFWTVARQTFL